MEGKEFSSLVKDKKFLWGLIIGVVVMLVIFGIVYGVQAASHKTLSAEKVKAKVIEYIKSQGGATATVPTIDSITSYNNGLYKLSISLGTQKAEAYVTKDGVKIFPVALDMTGAPAAPTGDNANANTPAPTAVTKNNKPKVELFVMSYCPYGTQIEKGIIPVVQALGNKIDFNLKFVNYAMHGQKELDENNRQYCIQKEQGDKLLPYLGCFLKSGDSASCVASSGVDQKKMDKCTASADKEFKITANNNDKATWVGDYPPFDINKADNVKYGVQGSPTLVVNGTTVNSGRDAASLLKAVCGAFSKEPDACKSNVSSATPAPGFGEGTQAAGTPTAGCATN